MLVRIATDTHDLCIYIRKVQLKGNLCTRVDKTQFTAYAHAGNSK